MRPNVIVIVPHDLGDYLGCYGRRVSTPNLDRLAGEGTRFANHFCTSPLCSPARGSLITGRYPHTNGLMGLVNLGWDMPDRGPSDAQRFSGAGYDTYLVGFQHEKKVTADLGFAHEHVGVYDGLEVARTTDQLLTEIAGRRTRGNERPFYMRLGTIGVHRLPDDAGYYGYEWAHGEGLRDSDVEVFPQWMDTPRMRHDVAAFTGDVRRLDAAMGVVLDALARTGLDEDTIVVFVSDHGIDYPFGKSTLYDLGIRTALVIRAPGRRGVATALSSHVDVLPTLLELCDVDPGAGIEGVSLVPLLDGGAAPVRDEIFAEESTFPKNLMRCIRTERFKLICNIDTGRKSNAGVCGLDVIEGSGDYYFVERPEFELYDLERDPYERENVAGRAEYEGIQADLRKRLDSWMRETGDPAVDGGVERPHDELDILRALPDQFQNEHYHLLWK